MASPSRATSLSDTTTRDVATLLADETFTPGELELTILRYRPDWSEKLDDQTRTEGCRSSFDH
ncbi:hypothetical protein WN51_09688 [Melipona quadrifasciata]|uniref:Uncharacterized protein n=1 Tax=Melipona quadrifasciata TaxID=166423 RepID=A0A0M9A6B9_9HYME|nr:hypothetical protein WN51_09688 [Melipona quadrifasciata]